jgi:hypothetical protein
MKKIVKMPGPAQLQDPEVSMEIIARMYNLIFMLLKAVLKESQISGIFNGGNWI